MIWWLASNPWKSMVKMIEYSDLKKQYFSRPIDSAALKHVRVQILSPGLLNIKGLISFRWKESAL